MSKEEIKKWQKDHPNGKASLSWDTKDYEMMGDEAPECLQFKKTEGETMDREAIEEWVSETMSCLSVLNEEYPERFKEQYSDFVLNLEYLLSLGKITQEELDETIKMENFSFGQK